MRGNAAADNIRGREAIVANESAHRQTCVRGAIELAVEVIQPDGNPVRCMPRTSSDPLIAAGLQNAGVHFVLILQAAARADEIAGGPEVG